MSINDDDDNDDDDNIGFIPHRICPLRSASRRSKTKEKISGVSTCDTAVLIKLHALWGRTQPFSTFLPRRNPRKNVKVSRNP